MIFYQTPAPHDAITVEIKRERESEVEVTCKRCNYGRMGGGISWLAIGSLQFTIHQRRANARPESRILFHQSRLKLGTSTMKIIAT